MQMQILKIYREFCKFSNYLQPLVLLVFRLTWGWQFFLSGKGKLLNHNNVSEFFTSLGIPFPELNAWVVGGVECIGGLLSEIFTEFTKTRIVFCFVIEDLFDLLSLCHFLYKSVNFAEFLLLPVKIFFAVLSV